MRWIRIVFPSRGLESLSLRRNVDEQVGNTVCKRNAFYRVYVTGRGKRHAALLIQWVSKRWHSADHDGGIRNMAGPTEIVDRPGVLGPVTWRFELVWTVCARDVQVPQRNGFPCPALTTAQAVKKGTMNTTG